MAREGKSDLPASEIFFGGGRKKKQAASYSRMKSPDLPTLHQTKLLIKS
jgi:hypothetical protein